MHRDALGANGVDLVLGGRHVRLVASVDDHGLLDAGGPLCRADAVHRDVAGADDGDPAADPGAALVVGLPQEVEGVDDHLLALADGALAARPGAGGDDHVGVGPLQLDDRVVGVGAEVEADAEADGQPVVALDLLPADPERRDDVADDAVGAVELLEDVHVHPVAAQEHRGGDTCRSRADHGRLAVAAQGRGRRGGDEGVLRPVGRLELDPTHVDGLVVVEPGAVVAALL